MTPIVRFDPKPSRSGCLQSPTAELMKDQTRRTTMSVQNRMNAGSSGGRLW